MLSRKFLSAILAGTAALGISMAATAAVNGPYVGGQIGIANLHYSANDFISGTSADVHNTNLAGSIFAGYQFTQNFAAELGFTQFSNAKFENIDGISGLDGKIKENAFDLVGKGILPLQYGFNLYGKAGVAYVTADPSINYGPVTLDGDIKHRLYPTFGAGVAYDITQNIPVDVSWTRIQKVGNSPIQSTDFFGVGIAYNFG